MLDHWLHSFSANQIGHKGEKSEKCKQRSALLPFPLGPEAGPCLNAVVGDCARSRKKSRDVDRRRGNIRPCVSKRTMPSRRKEGPGCYGGW